MVSCAACILVANRYTAFFEPGKGSEYPVVKLAGDCWLDNIQYVSLRNSAIPYISRVEYRARWSTFSPILDFILCTF